MRLHRLVMTGIGPFKERQEIDFDELASSGLFLIEGPTGSGKTTIIDAIVYALFGVVSSGADDVTAMRIRSHYCSDTDPSGVELSFTVDGRTHVVRRVPKGARDPEDSGRRASARPTRQFLTETVTDGREPQTWTRSDEVREHITELLGMTAEQFRQLVVLPQGQFAELLRQTPADRLKSLAPLLEDPFVARVQDDLKRQGDLAQVERAKALKKVESAADQLEGRLKTYLADDLTRPDVSFADDAATDEERTDAVETILGALREAAQAAEAEHARQRADVERLRDTAAKADEVLGALRDAADAQLAVTSCIKALHPDDADVVESSVDARIGDLRQLEGSLGEHARWESEAPQRATVRIELVQQREEASAAAADLGVRKASLPDDVEAAHERRGTAQALAGGLEAVRREETRLGELVGAARQLAEANAFVVSRAEAARDAEALEAESLRAERDAVDRWRARAEHLQLATAADLAALLVDGEPCPVCGAADHPSPAAATEGTDTVTAKDVQAALKQSTQAQQAREAASRTATAARNDLAAAEAQAATLAGRVEGRSEEELIAAESEATQRRLAAEEAVEELPRIDARLRELAAEGRELDARIAHHLAEATRLQERIDNHDRAERRTAESIREAIGSAESATALLEETQARTRLLENLAGAWKQHATALAAVPADRRELTVAQAQEQAQAAEAAHAAQAATLVDLEARATTVAAMLKEATPLADAFVSAMAERRDIDRGTAAAIGLAGLVTAGNSRRLQLRSYALQRRFESVLAAGSVHLERMSSGKFAFELNEEAAKAGQAGLGILLYDSWTGRTQDPKSLSGGETFYASLALALGLADVIRSEAGGSSLETLFVDEGFGSLDQDTLYQVLEQLDQLRAGHRAVGVVSHVTEMKESIPDRIEVRRLPDSTSTIARAEDQD